MVKRVVWTKTTRDARREILEYWITHNRSKTYSGKLSNLFKKKIELLKSQSYIGKPTDFDEVRSTLVNHFTIFYKITTSHIIVVGIWDNREILMIYIKTLRYKF